MKTYTALATAQKISAKKEGTQVYEVGQGQFAVLTAEQFAAWEASKSETPAPAKAADKPATPAKETKNAAAQEIVTVTVPKAKITKQYVITEVLGDRPRWFEIKRLASAPVANGTDVTFNCTRATLLSRGLKDLAAKAPLAK